MEILSSAQAVFNGNHVDPDTGILHGHDYVVTAWWPWEGMRLDALEHRLEMQLAPLDHAMLPDGIWSAEALAGWLLRVLDCVEVEVCRPAINHKVRARG